MSLVKFDGMNLATAQISEMVKSAFEKAIAENKSGRLDKVKKDLETANKTIEAANKDDYKGKYESEKAKNRCNINNKK